jgi:hypothetical protein
VSAQARDDALAEKKLAEAELKGCRSRPMATCASAARWVSADGFDIRVDLPGVTPQRSAMR